MVATRFFPRARLREKWIPSPEGGSPVVKVKLSNNRFEQNETLVVTKANAPTEVNLGPAKIRFSKLWNAEDDKRFFENTKPPAQKSTLGRLVAQFQSIEKSWEVSNVLHKKLPLESTSFKIEVLKYLPYAVVDGGKLISKSNEPMNPAVQLKVSDGKGKEEMHTVFANFPEFGSLHQNLKPKNEKPFGFQFRLLSSQEGAKGASLEFTQSSDDKKLFYRVFNREGIRSGIGEVMPGKAIATGWMNLQFSVLEWIPSAFKKESVEYLDRVASGDGQLPSAIYLEFWKGHEKETSFWLGEGAGKNTWLGGKSFLVRFGRRAMELPFGLELLKFKMTTDPGTQKAATYSSDVRVLDKQVGLMEAQTISMNEPLKHGGYTFYQASFSQNSGEATVSVFSVNWDPGLWIKYLGSIVMVLGIVLMFYFNPHYWSIFLGTSKGN